MTHVKFALRTLIHPFDCFWDLKFEKRGNMVFAICLYALYFVTTIFRRQFAAFLFNPAYNTPVLLGYELRLVILPMFLFVLSNWAITTLMDGKGHARDIFMVACYSLVPIVFTNLILAILTNTMSLSESIYMTAIDAAGIIWFALLLFIGIMSVHQYSLIKTVSTFVLTAAACAVIIFIALLFFSLLQEISSFLYSIYRETTLRLQG